MTYQEITDLYREIGRTFRDLGAMRVYLAHSRAVPDADHEMELEIVLDTDEETTVFSTESKNRWPQINIQISRIIDDMNRDCELVEDAVLL